METTHPSSPATSLLQAFMAALSRQDKPALLYSRLVVEVKEHGQIQVLELATRDAFTQRTISRFGHKITLPQDQQIPPGIYHLGQVGIQT